MEMNIKHIFLLSFVFCMVLNFFLAGMDAYIVSIFNVGYFGFVMLIVLDYVDFQKELSEME